MAGDQETGDGGNEGDTADGGFTGGNGCFFGEEYVEFADTAFFQFSAHNPAQRADTGF